MYNTYFENYEELACDIADKFDGVRELDDLNDIAIIAKYEEARQIIKELLCIGYDLKDIELHDPIGSNYNAEYVISLINVEGEDEIWCEPFLRNNGYFTEDATIIYVLDNCSSKVIPYCKSKVVFEVSIGLDEEDFLDENYYCCCDECCECEENEIDEDTHGFTVTNSDENGTFSYSFYSTDRNLVAEMLKKFK